MEEPLVSISVNLLLILRLFGGLSWGFAWAAFIQFNRWGQFLVEERTWITVVIGVGTDLLIAYNADWWVVTAIVSASAIGIIARSLWNESTDKKGKRPMSNKALWNLTDITTLALDNISILHSVLNDTDDIPQKAIMPLSRTLTNTHKIKGKVEDARDGLYREPVNV